MSSSGSVSTWIAQLREGDEAALGKLHARYWPALVAMARRRLHGSPGPVDEEDVAQEAFWRFYRGMKEGRLPRLANRHDLLALLTHIVACTAINQIEREQARKRGGDIGQRLSVELLAESAAGEKGPSRPDASPLEQAILNDCYQHYVGSLPEKLRGFAESHLAGCTHRETAGLMNCSERTVERKIALILQKWQEMAEVSVQAEPRP